MWLLEQHDQPLVAQPLVVDALLDLRNVADPRSGNVELIDQVLTGIRHLSVVRGKGIADMAEAMLMRTSGQGLTFEEFVARHADQLHPHE